MKSVGKSWRRRITCFLALYAFISISIGAMMSSTSVASLNSPPLPAEPETAVVQVYAARTWGKKGAFAVHSWIVTKRRSEVFYSRHEILGWKLRWSPSALRSRQLSPYDDLDWFGNRATLLVDHRGADAEAMIDRLETAIENYPYKNQYQIWPGPNSNTFTAYLGLAVPELRLDLPATAIGKDYRPAGDIIGRSASGTGVQFSMLGVAGVSLGYEEGIEANLLGLNFEWDIFDLAIELPVLGRIGYRQ
jgi:hypothetical protein